MNLAFYSGVSGMVGFQQDMDLLAHNMANVNTYGYKPMRMAFQDILYTKMAINNEEPELTGHGVKPAAVNLINHPGNLMNTGYKLDYAILGDGYFAVEREGTVEYTRNGAFAISVEGKNAFLTTSDGAYVLDSSGKRIKLEKEEGSEVYNTESLGETLGVYQFPNPSGLQWTDRSSFLPTAVSGEAVAANGAGAKKDITEFQLRHQALEASGVDLAQTMVDVMMAQRSFQFNARVVQTADQLEEIVNTLRG